jgi:hypothetical protein
VCEGWYDVEESVVLLTCDDILFFLVPTSVVVLVLVLLLKLFQFHGFDGVGHQFQKHLKGIGGQ